MDGLDGISEGTEDTTMIVQIQEERRPIRTMSFVTKSSSVGTHNGHGDRWESSHLSLE